jgi:hypothetical protein
LQPCRPLPISRFIRLVPPLEGCRLPPRPVGSSRFRLTLNSSSCSAPQTARRWGSKRISHTVSPTLRKFEAAVVGVRRTSVSAPAVQRAEDSDSEKLRMGSGERLLRDRPLRRSPRCRSSLGILRRGGSRLFRLVWCWDNRAAAKLQRNRATLGGLTLGDVSPDLAVWLRAGGSRVRAHSDLSKCEIAAVEGTVILTACHLMQFQEEKDTKWEIGSPRDSVRVARRRSPVRSTGEVVTYPCILHQLKLGYVRRIHDAQSATDQGTTTQPGFLPVDPVPIRLNHIENEDETAPPDPLRSRPSARFNSIVGTASQLLLQRTPSNPNHTR